MPSPSHHPSFETLAAFGAGTQRLGFDVVTAVHVRGCRQCQRQIAAIEEFGGMSLAASEPLALGDEALAATLARLDATAPAATPARTLDDIMASAKRRWVAPGVWVAPLDTPHDRQDRVYLLNVNPGAATAHHTHAGLEFTQVMKGALNDEGVVYAAGDFCERDQTHAHRPEIVGNEPCLCLFATRGRLKATGLFGRIGFALADV